MHIQFSMFIYSKTIENKSIQVKNKYSTSIITKLYIEKNIYVGRKTKIYINYKVWSYTKGKCIKLNKVLQD